MQVRYVGMFDEVIVPEVSRAGAIRRGDPVEVAASVGERLLVQRESWEAVPVEKPAKGRE
ncbi:MAG: hypothetical protein ACM3W4_07080 [Ignavibacteriales bacterium]